MTLITRIGLHPSPIEGNGAKTRRTASWTNAFRCGTNLAAKSDREWFSQELKPVFTAATEAFKKLPLSTRVELANISHDEGYFKPNVLPELLEGIVVAPVIEDAGKRINILLTKDNADQLKACLTHDARIQVDNMVSGEFVGKAFVTAPQILPDKLHDFFAFFNRFDANVIDRVKELAANDSKIKILNTLYMSSRSFSIYVNAFYSDPVKNAGMKEMFVDLQAMGVADAALVMAALDLGLIPQDQRYVRMHEAWATHNSWEPMAAVNYIDLPPAEQSKDRTILNTLVWMRAQLSPLIEVIKASAEEEENGPIICHLPPLPAAPGQ